MAPEAGSRRLRIPPSGTRRNHGETADRFDSSYVVARCLLDEEKSISTRLKKRNLWTLQPVSSWPLTTSKPTSDNRFANQALSLEGTVKLTVRKKSGEEWSKETTVGYSRPLSHAEIIEKFNRACDYQKIDKDTRDRARDMWLNLRASEGYGRGDEDACQVRAADRAVVSHSVTETAFTRPSAG